MASREIGFSQLGLANIIKQNKLIVPPNQREYSWTNKEVKTLFQDFAKAIAGDSNTTYFLGTIVTIPRGKDNDLLEVVDGQQRLATTAIMLAAIRDYLKDRDEMISQSIDNEFLSVIERSSRERIPRLSLNLDDNEYFRARLTGQIPPPSISKPSHKLIDNAFKEAVEQVKNIVSGYDQKDHGDVLNTWITFMETRALAILLRVPNDSDAYKMFETLNDRGLRTSQSDLVKNYLFGKAGDRISEVQQKWAFMRGALETIEDDDITITFLRHALTVIYGFVRQAQVYDTVQDKARASRPVVTFITQLESLANSYVAIHNSEHEMWNDYKDSARKAIEVLNLISVKPLRPLMLALAEKFSRKDAASALQFCVSLAVRLMIAGTTRTGAVEEGVAAAANKVYNGTVDTAEKLRKDLQALTPTDTRFKADFETGSVSNRRLARYYLRSMELASNGDAQPWHIPNDDKTAINLEHILPEKPEGNWPQFNEDEVKLYYRRIGNVCLLRASDNSGANNQSFEDKKAIYRVSPYRLTKEVADADKWDADEIARRQRNLAQVALKTWPI